MRSGSIFNCPPMYSLGHCISADAKMGKGVAKEFVQRYPILCSLRKPDKQNIVGTAVVVPVGPKFIYNLVTKSAFWMKPSPSTLRDCLESMLCHAVNNHVKDICVPKLGCGLDNLNFRLDVLPIMEAVFSDSMINIYVYSIDTIPRYVVFILLLTLKARWWNL